MMRHDLNRAWEVHEHRKPSLWVLIIIGMIAGGYVFYGAAKLLYWLAAPAIYSRTTLDRYL